MDFVIVDDIYNSREPRFYSDVAPTLRSERSGLIVAPKEAVISSVGIGNDESDDVNEGVSVHPFSHRLEFKGFNKEFSPALRATDYKAPLCTKIGSRIRKLTPRECFRFMDVSETDIDKIQASNVSDSQQYKLAGNSIVVNVLYCIFDKLFVNTEPKDLQLKLF